MCHSIIIPHRRRFWHLSACLRSIKRSADAHGITAYEVVVVNDSPDDLLNMLLFDRHLRICSIHRPGHLFNKPLLQNIGIELATGDVLSFLDADAIVGRDWMQNVVDRLDGLTKLCYRVRSLPLDISALAGSDDNAFDAAVLEAFRNWDSLLPNDYPLAFEGRGKPETSAPYGEPLFGNSQFSIRRDVLGDLRFDEEYVGAGYEDIAFNREVWRKYGDAYLAEMPTEGERCLLHINHHRVDQPAWRNTRFRTANFERYHGT